MTQPPSDQGFPVNMREGVIWAYRHLLGREPNDEFAIAVHLGHTPTSLREAFRASPEYRLREGLNSGSATHSAVLDRFRPFATELPPSGSWRDFLGVQTRCAFLPDAYQSWSGLVQGPPGAANGSVHDIEEWVGVLRSVLEAKDRLVVVELGAGWGPWLVAGTKAAERVGIHDIRLVGVEGSLGHVEYMRSHLLDNGIDPTAHTLIHGVVGVADGIAHFPKLSEPNNTYGSEADYDRRTKAEEMEEVRSISLQSLLADLPPVDILHCDVQGAESEVFRAGHAIVDQRVRRLVIGTHGRRIEAELLDLFSGLGWALEEETVCKLIQAPNAKLLLVKDGVQVWRNPRFTG